MLLLGLAASGSALADHDEGRVHFGVYVGQPDWDGWDWDAPPPVYYSPPQVVVVPERPPVYVQRRAAPRRSWWYYCRAAKAYYPYVKHCPGGWQRVAPQPPPG